MSPATIAAAAGAVMRWGAGISGSHGDGVPLLATSAIDVRPYLHAPVVDQAPLLFGHGVAPARLDRGRRRAREARRRARRRRLGAWGIGLGLQRVEVVGPVLRGVVG